MERYMDTGQLSTKLHTCHVHKILDIHPASLRTYELEGLVSPFYHTGERFFSREQLVWINCIEHMINEKGISIPGLTRLLRLCPCWEIAECPEETRCQCKAKSISLSIMDSEKKEELMAEEEILAPVTIN